MTIFEGIATAWMLVMVVLFFAIGRGVSDISSQLDSIRRHVSPTVNHLKGRCDFHPLPPLSRAARLSSDRLLAQRLEPPPRIV